MKKVKQFRYYGTSNPKNYPSSLTYGQMHSGNIFSSCGIITQLGIQAIPGSKFYLNKSAYPIEIGATGIYELDLEGIGVINAIRFDKKTLEQVLNNDRGILIDIVYEEGRI